MEYYSVIRKNEIMSFAATWMDLETVTLSEGSQRQFHVISLMCEIECMTQMNIKQKQT